MDDAPPTSEPPPAGLADEPAPAKAERKTRRKPPRTHADRTEVVPLSELPLPLPAERAPRRKPIPKTAEVPSDPLVAMPSLGGLTRSQPPPRRPARQPAATPPPAPAERVLPEEPERPAEPAPEPVEASAAPAAPSTVRRPPPLPPEDPAPPSPHPAKDSAHAVRAPARAAAPAPSEKLPPTPMEARDLWRHFRRDQRKRLEREVEDAGTLRRRLRERLRKARDEERLASDAHRHEAMVRAQLGGLDPARPITEIPPLDAPELTEVEIFTIEPDRAYVRILYDNLKHQHVYEVLEPRLTAEEERVRAFLRDTLVRTLAAETPAGTEMRVYLRDAIARAIVEHDVIVDPVSQERIMYYLVRDFLGYGPIDALVRDPLIEDISCDGPAVPIYLFHRQYESIRTNVVFPTELELDGFVMQLAQRCGKHISIAEPLLDATLPDKSRLQASLSKEVTTCGSTFTIRKFRADPMTPPDLVRLGALTARMAAYFWIAVEQGSSLVLAGGTASGKTTTLNAVCQFIPTQKKVVSIEDTREINLVHENWIPGLTRTGFGETVVGGKLTGTIDMYRLLEEALRQRPEFLLVGEVRGPEAQTLFQAMATGHATYSTLHADSAESAILRLENPPISVPRVMLQTLDCIAIQAQARVNQRLVRRIREVVELDGLGEDGKVKLHPVFRWDRRTDTHEYLGDSRILRSAMEHDNLSEAAMEEDWRNRTTVIEWMVEKGIRQIKDTSAIIAQYYSDPDALIQRAARELGELRAAKAKEAHP